MYVFHVTMFGLTKKIISKKIFSLYYYIVVVDIYYIISVILIRKLRKKNFKINKKNLENFDPNLTMIIIIKKCIE